MNEFLGMERNERKEQLFGILFDVLSELTEYECPEIIFDRIVDDFAANAEYHMNQADTFKVMLDTFRHDNPAETVPEDTNTVSEEASYLLNYYNELPTEDPLGLLNDINKEYLLEDRNKLLDLLHKNVKDQPPNA